MDFRVVMAMFFEITLFFDSPCISTHPPPQAQQLDELSLVKGSRVMILEKSGDGWWRGQYGNKVH